MLPTSIKVGIRRFTSKLDAELLIKSETWTLQCVIAPKLVLAIRTSQSLITAVVACFQAISDFERDKETETSRQP